MSKWQVWVSAISIGGAIACPGYAAWGQVQGDRTLGQESSTVTSPDRLNFQVDGGATRGPNLFHSFAQFSVPTGGSVLFNNAPTIANIFSRVTGSSISNIDGLIRANGAANLFLLNPNGILFGPNAQLKIGGSFVASTADSFQFDNGAFSASNPQAPPLLTVNVPVGLQYGSDPGSVQVQGATLRMAPGQTLALLGGNVSINGGRLLAPEGRVELGGVAAEGSLGLHADGSYLSLSFSDTVGRADIFLDRGAELNVRNYDGGSIAINARNINISGGSRVRAGIALGAGAPQSQTGDIELNATAAVQVTGGSILANNTSGQGNAGAVRISARDFVSLDGESSSVQSAVGPGAVGNSGGIIINTGTLYLTNGVLLNGEMLGQGHSGSITINARDAIIMDGPEDPNAPLGSVSFINSGLSGEGNGGDINITTGSLSLRNGSTLFSGIVDGGKGNAGSININARDTVTIDGGNKLNQTSGIRSNIFEGKGNSGDINIVTGSLFVRNGGVLNTDVESVEGGAAGNINIKARDTVSFEGASSTGIPSRALGDLSSQSGNGGDINITTRSVSVGSGAVLNTQAEGQGSGGNITINTDTIDVFKGGQLGTTSFGNGKAGNITVNATNSVNISGSDPTYYDRLAQLSQFSASNEIVSLVPSSGLFANTSETSTGPGGKLIVNTRQLNIQNGAEVTVSSLGTGSAGSLFIDANQIYLNNQGSIRADTSGSGGNINLRSPLILLRHGSNITTNAQGRDVIGGNITINTDNLVAVPKENSDISANSQNSFGGRVIINAQGVFGTQFTLQDTPLSDITASSALGPRFNGIVQINTPGTDPSRGVAALPTNLYDPARAIANSCVGRRYQPKSSFIVTGVIGLPVQPDDPTVAPFPTYVMPTVASSRDMGPTEGGKQIASPQQNHQSAAANPPVPALLEEAQGWVYGPHGEVILTAIAPTATPHSARPSPQCPASWKP